MMGPDISRQARCRAPASADQKETCTIMPQSLMRGLALDFVLESVLGTPAELWLGKPGESPSARAARLDAAVDILAEDPDAPGAGFLSGLLLEDVVRSVEFVASSEPDDNEPDEDAELAEAA